MGGDDGRAEVPDDEAEDAGEQRGKSARDHVPAPGDLAFSRFAGPLRRFALGSLGSAGVGRHLRIGRPCRQVAERLDLGWRQRLLQRRDEAPPVDPVDALALLSRVLVGRVGRPDVRPAPAGPVADLVGPAPVGDRPRDGDGGPDVRRRFAGLADVLDAREHDVVDGILLFVLVANPLFPADRTDYVKYRRIVQEALVRHRPDAVPQAPRKIDAAPRHKNARLVSTGVREARAGRRRRAPPPLSR